MAYYFTIERGDMVEVNLTMHTDLEKPNQFESGMVVTVEEGANEVEVLFSDNEEPRVINVKQIIDIDKEYKVMTITDNVERATNKPVTIIELSRFDKIYQFDGTNYNIISFYSAASFDVFVYYEDSEKCAEICNNPTENVTIRISDYILKTLNYKGNLIKGFYEDNEQ
jgi:hypothetical protein